MPLRRVGGRWRHLCCCGCPLEEQVRPLRRSSVSLEQGSEEIASFPVLGIWQTPPYNQVRILPRFGHRLGTVASVSE